MSKRRKRQSPDFLRPYIAAKLKTLPETFILGDEKTYNGFYNKALPGQQQYCFFVLAALQDHDSVSVTHTNTHTPQCTYSFCLSGLTMA